MLLELARTDLQVDEGVVTLDNAETVNLRVGGYRLAGMVLDQVGEPRYVTIVILEATVGIALFRTASVLSLHEHPEGAVEAALDGSGTGSQVPDCMAEDSFGCCRPDGAAAMYAALLEAAGLRACEIAMRLAALGFAVCVIALALGLSEQAVEGMIRRRECPPGGGGGSGPAPSPHPAPAPPPPIAPAVPIGQSPGELAGCYMFCTSLYFLLMEECYAEYMVHQSEQQLAACKAAANGGLIRCLAGCH